MPVRCDSGGVSGSDSGAPRAAGTDCSGNCCQKERRCTALWRVHVIKKRHYGFHLSPLSVRTIFCSNMRFLWNHVGVDIVVIVLGVHWATLPAFGPSYGLIRETWTLISALSVLRSVLVKMWNVSEDGKSGQMLSSSASLSTLWFCQKVREDLVSL